VIDEFDKAGGLDPLVVSRQQMAEIVRADYAKYGAVVKEIGIKIE
jgi:hypothetical protein